MGESTSQIERDIAAERNELGRNLQLLENKARSLADWRTHFRNHPFAMVGLALGGGVLLGALTSGVAAGDQDEEFIDEQTEAEPRFSRPSALASSAARARRQLGDTWDHIADALLAVASAKAIEFVGEKVPGFREQFSAKHPERGGYGAGRSV
jgi:hypothetical protein